MSNAYCLITSGPMFGICDAWLKAVQKGDEAVNALALKYGATPGRMLRCGPKLEGLYFPRPADVLVLNKRGWRVAGKRHPGYYKPDIRKQAGRDIEHELNAVTLKTFEDLANDLELPPFFKDEGGDWCTAVNCFMRGGVFYVEFPGCFSYHFAKKDGIELIPEWQYLKAKDET